MRESLRYRLWRIGLGLTAIGLLALAIPQAIVSISRVRIEYGLEPIDFRDPDAAARVSNAAAQLRLLDDRYGSPHARIRAGLLQLQLGLSPPFEASAQPAVALALDDLTRGLDRAPANAPAWNELANAHYALGNSAAALQAWRGSLKVSAYDPSISLRRTEMGLKLSLLLTPDDRNALRDQLEYAFENDTEQLARLAQRDAWLGSVIRSLLPDKPKRRAEFESYMTQHR